MNATTMQALRVQVAGPVTSFRHPHFMHGMQPTYTLPPPATLYGHVCSALGQRVAPDAFRVAFHFSYSTRWLDYEHTHLFVGKEAKLSPFERELLFQPRLTLYLDRPDWTEAFRSPRYVVTLGRSQDLMQVQTVDVVTLPRHEQAYITQTLLPLHEAAHLMQWTAITMPRYMTEDRTPQWGHYAQIGPPQRFNAPTWTDPHAPRWQQRPRAVNWLSFV